MRQSLLYAQLSSFNHLFLYPHPTISLCILVSLYVNIRQLIFTLFSKSEYYEYKEICMSFLLGAVV